jgi:hypothetical protein
MHNHHRCHEDSYKGKYIHKKTNRDKYTQHYKHQKYEHRKEQKYNDKPQFSPIKDDNNEKNMDFDSMNNKYDNYREGKFHTQTSKGDSFHFEHKDKQYKKYFSHDKKPFEFNDRKIRDHSNKRYHNYKHHRHHFNHNSNTDEHAPPPVQFSN